MHQLTSRELPNSSSSNKNSATSWMIDSAISLTCASEDVLLTPFSPFLAFLFYFPSSSGAIDRIASRGELSSSRIR